MPTGPDVSTGIQYKCLRATLDYIRAGTTINVNRSYMSVKIQSQGIPLKNQMQVSRHFNELFLCNYILHLV